MTGLAALRDGRRGRAERAPDTAVLGASRCIVLGLFTELMTSGGIQRTALHAAAALVDLARREERPVRFLSLNDPVGRHELRVAGEVVPLLGFGGVKARFALATVATVRHIGFAYIGHPNLAPLGIVAKLLRPRAWYCVATYGIEVWEPLPAFRRLGLKWARVVTSVSEFTAKRLVTAQGLAGRPVVIVPPGLDPILSGNGPRRSLPLLPPGRMLLTVARLTASDSYKGVGHVIQALPAVLSAVPDAYYVVVGDGDDRGRLERLAVDARVRDHVLFVGTKADEELAGYYQACDAFVMPSRSEGFGIVFLEAMSHGKPVVAANSGATPELVEDGVTGLLVEYGVVQTLASSLTRLLTDRECRQRMGEAGRRRVEAQFTFKHFRTRLETLLTDAARS
jgi:glycosyltransferase involved in cell wall biosynthesis